MISTLTKLAFFLSSLQVASVHCSVIMEATAIMQMSWTASSPQALSTEEVYQYNVDMAVFLMDSISTDEQDTVLGSDNYPFQLTVDVRDQSQSDSDQAVEAVVTCLYISEGLQVNLDTVLMRHADRTTLPYQDAQLAFRPYEDSYVLTTTNKGPTKADLGLIIATCFLTVMLVVVSSVLLYVTGGWDVCQQKCSNCCFEEVDDDYAIDNKSTFQVEDPYDDNENGSVETGMVTTGSGVLGAQLTMNHPGHGLAVNTPVRNRMDDETATPMSINQPLGIMSMRKMHSELPEEKGGLTTMIMNRMMPYSNK